MTAYNYTVLNTTPPWDAGKIFTVQAYYDLGGVALASGDTITATNLIPNNGIEIVDVVIAASETDTDATPTGTFNVGDGDDADRFIVGIPMGINGATTAGLQLMQNINRATASTNGVITAGAGYIYSASTPLVTTVASTVATGATTGVIRKIVTYRCVGNS